MTIRQLVGRLVRGPKKAQAPVPAAPEVVEPSPRTTPDATEENERAVRAFLPSLGYFGGIAVSCLTLRVAHPIVEIRLTLGPGRTGQIDLRGLELVSGGRRVPVADESTTISQSSVRAPSGRGPFAMGGVRTEREQDPWWTVRFAEPVAADELRVYNRIDGYGNRAQHLQIVVVAAEPHLSTEYAVDSPDVREATVALVDRLTGVEVPSSVFVSEEVAARTRAEVLRELAHRAGQGFLTEDREEQRLLAALVRTRQPGDAGHLPDAEWALLAHLLVSERLRLPGTATSMRSFHLLLGSRTALRRLQSEVDRAGTVLGAPQAVVTRHGLTEVGGLRRRSDDHLAMIERATGEFRDIGYPAMIAYGTLLGAVREGDFLAHDDDIDMLIPIEASSKEEVEEVYLTVHRLLRERGWNVSRPNSYLNFHLTDPATHLHLDVFPLLVQGERTQLHMEKMQLRDIATDVVLPPSPITFLGHELLAPAQPEQFLEERYGEGWISPDPFYDWPWRLRD